MALAPSDFLAQAPLLMEAGGEAGYRSAINRAYYACHLMARAPHPRAAFALP